VLADPNTFDANFHQRATDSRYRINGSLRDDYVKTRLDAAFTDTVDFLLYPSVQGFNGTASTGPDTGGTHRLSAYSGYPAIAFPAGWAQPGIGLPVEPVGVELLGKKGTDMALLQLVQRLQKQLTARVVPPLQ
jgi:Asp-tRNA(Asn)/Glu-tRNA(Gln) amidotransferase A subunit family amidase